MAEAIVSATVEMLGDLLIQEGSFLYGVRNQVRELQAELQRMQCFLKDADKKQYESQSVRNWVRSIRNLAYKTENVLETYAFKVQSRKGKGIKKTLKRFACVLDEAVNLHKIGLEIGNIKTELESLRASSETYGINRDQNEGESSNAANKNWLRQTFPHEIEEHFVGMQKDIDTLVSLLVDRDGDHRIISIYGMGGSGKTTLAKQIFNHLDVQHRFESFAWVTVSQQFVANSLLQEILRQLDRTRNKDDIKNMECTELVEELCKVQKEKKCFVVVDDIWRTEDWNILKHAFLDSKVLLTTRIKEVAKIGIAHKLDLLTPDESWQLFAKKAAFIGGNDRDAYVQVGKEMVRKCGNLPLAISVIGGILREKETLKEWQIVNRNMDSYLMRGHGMEENREVMQILALSFDDLPYQLKSCFLYLAYYPEDTVIDVEEMFWIWIAEGMILSQDKGENETLMEVAQKYLSDMVNRSLVQVQLDELSMTSRYKSCSLHDLMHDLCLRKCKEEDFLEVMDFRGGKRPISKLSSAGGNSCRLAFYLEDHKIGNDKIFQEANEWTRFYSVRSKNYEETISFKISENFGNLRFLKMVTFGRLVFENPKLLQKVMGKLIHLRFLSFRYCSGLDEVLSAVVMLPYLQTFYFFSIVMVEMPAALWKSRRLIHLVLRNVKGKLRLDGLSGLETLICSKSLALEVEGLPQMTNLRDFRMRVRDNESLSVIINCIEVNWHNILDMHLEIVDPCDFISTKDGFIWLHKLLMYHGLIHLSIMVPLRELPKYESNMLVNLVNLIFSNSCIVEDPMPTLERLPKLKLLYFFGNSFLGEELICSSIGFPHLIDLKLSHLPNLKKWRIDEGAMPILSHVGIYGCKKLEMIPDGMEFLKALRELESWFMPIEFNNRIRVIDGQEGADCHKVRHVPSINITRVLPS